MDNTQKLLEAAAGIRDAVLDGENTASRVGAMFVSIIQAMQHFPGQMVDASTIKFSNGKTATHITFNIIDSAGKTSAVDISVPAVSSTSAGLLTPEKAEEYDAAVTDVAAIKKRMPGSEKGLLLSGFRHGPTTEGVTFIFDAIGADGTIVPQQILVPLVSAGSPGVVTKAQMDAVTTKAEEAKAAANEAKSTASIAASMADGAGTAANEAKVTAHSASVAAQEAKGTASQAKSTAEGAATTADAAKAAADGAAKGVRDINAVVGEPDGIATLGTDGKVPVEQVPALGYLPLTKVVGVDTQAHIEESIDLGYTGAGIYFVTDYNYGEGAFCKVTVTDGVVDFDDDGAQPSDAALQGYFLETSTGALWQMDAGELVEVPTQDALTEVTQKAKLALFVDMWNQAWGQYGKYDPENAPDAQHPFMGNEIWMTYEEAVDVILVSDVKTLSQTTAAFKYLRASDTPSPRTLLPVRIYSANIQWLFGNQSRLEVVSISHYTSHDAAALVANYNYCFEGCLSLNKIIGALDLQGAPTGNFCTRDIPLEEFYVKTNKSLQFGHFPKISLASLQYMVENAANTSAITITVHPDVYAKLTGDTTNEAAAALSAEELAQWQGVVTAATGKSITFATD